MPTYKTEKCFCTSEAMSETSMAIIDDYRKTGFTCCGDQTEMDGDYCFIYLVFAKDTEDEQYPAESE
jgi:hypothetical protein